MLIFIGHDYGAAVYVRAVQVDVSDKITAEDVHEAGEVLQRVQGLFPKKKIGPRQP